MQLNKDVNTSENIKEHGFYSHEHKHVGKIVSIFKYIIPFKSINVFCAFQVDVSI